LYKIMEKSNNKKKDVAEKLKEKAQQKKEWLIYLTHNFRFFSRNAISKSGFKWFKRW
jgi:hypothetical protein